MDAMILSYGLDTNGGNHRMAQAAAKWGTDPDVLKAFAIGKTDPAGVVARFQMAAEKFDSIRIRSAHRSVYDELQFPYDIHWVQRKTHNLVVELANAADIIHLNNSEAAYRTLRLRKPALLHHHGSLFRGNPPRMLQVAKQYRMVQAVSTIDLQKPAPDVLHWLPSAYDVDGLRAFADEHRREPDGRIRIVQCPTNREGKHTRLLVEAVKVLQDEGLPVDLDIVGPDQAAGIPAVPWIDSLKAKASADIVFDQLMWGYGCNSIEAWCMGVPVVSGADDWTLGRMAKLWDAIPFEEANERTLLDVLRAMVKSADLREDAAMRGLNHVRTYHDEKPALAKLVELYFDAIKTYHRERIPGKGPAATFKSLSRRPVYLDDNPITFQDGTLQTDDPHVIARLRNLAKRPAFGITEEVA